VIWPTEYGPDSLLVVCTGCAAQRWWQVADVLLPPCRPPGAADTTTPLRNPCLGVTSRAALTPVASPRAVE
jgi:hypothetical protein